MEANIIEQAKQKISKEISEYENLKRENGIGVVVPSEERRELEMFLAHALETEEGLAELVLLPEKNILKCLSWCGSQIPKKLREHGMAVIENNIVFAWVLDYFRWDEAKEKAAREAAKAQDTAKYEERHRKLLAEREAREKEEQKAKSAKEESEKRKRMGVCEGQLDFFSLLDSASAATQDPDPAPAPIETKEDGYVTEITEEEQKNVDDLFSCNAFASEGLTAEDRATDFADEGGEDYA